MEEAHGSINHSILRFAAVPGEQNKVTVTRSTVTPGETVTLDVVDAGAALAAGPGCAGGGAPGAVATCTLHAAKVQEYKACGHDCFEGIPGTEWQTEMNVELVTATTPSTARHSPGCISRAGK